MLGAVAHQARRPGPVPEADCAACLRRHMSRLRKMGRVHGSPRYLVVPADLHYRSGRHPNRDWLRGRSQPCCGRAYRNRTTLDALGADPTSSLIPDHLGLRPQIACRLCCSWRDAGAAERQQALSPAQARTGKLAGWTPGTCALLGRSRRRAVPQLKNSADGASASRRILCRRRH